MLVKLINMTMSCVYLTKNQDHQMTWLGKHFYYIVRCQKRLLPTHKKWLKICCRHIIKKGVCGDANATHAWNRFRTSMGKENLYRNHLCLPNEKRQFFENLFDIDF